MAQSWSEMRAPCPRWPLLHAFCRLVSHAHGWPLLRANCWPLFHARGWPFFIAPQELEQTYNSAVTSGNDQGALIDFLVQFQVLVSKFATNEKEQKFILGFAIVLSYLRLFEFASLSARLEVVNITLKRYEALQCCICCNFSAPFS